MMGEQPPMRVARASSREPQPAQAPYPPPTKIPPRPHRKPLAHRNVSNALHRSRRYNQSAPVILPSQVRNEDFIELSESDDEPPEPFPFKRRRLNDPQPSVPASSSNGIARQPSKQKVINVSSDDEDEDNGIPTATVQSADKNAAVPEPIQPAGENATDAIVPLMRMLGGKGKGKEKEPDVPNDNIAGPSAEGQRTEKVNKEDVPPEYIVPIPMDLDFDDPTMVEADVPIDPESIALADVLALFPDIQIQYASDLVAQYLKSHPDNTSEAIINHLCDDPKYPRAEKRQPKRKREDEENAGSSKAAPAPPPKPVNDFGSIERIRPPGPHYIELALNQLQQDFRYIQVKWIRNAFTSHNRLYYPTFKFLEQQLQNPGYPGYKKSATPTSKGKGAFFDEDFEAERAAILGIDIPRWTVPEQEQEQPVAGPSNAPTLEVVEEEAGGEIECGCCFGDYSFSQMVQCPDAHLFCRDCVRRNADEIVGNRKPVVPCMDQSGCKLEFGRAELERVLDEKVLELLDRIKAEKALDGVEIEGLEECPFCDFKVIIENDQEKLFRCENEVCGQVSCRQCKKPDHLPKSCKEMEEDKKLDARHAVEEAMTAALMRKCPKCSKSFIKEAGCNKMSCPNCATLSCYVCRKAITGYDHFDQTPAGQPARRNGKCRLWEDLETRHHEDVAEAARIAKELQQRENPDLDENLLNVELPKAPAPRPANPLVARPQAYPPIPYVPPALPLDRPMFPFDWRAFNLPVNAPPAPAPVPAPPGNMNFLFQAAPQPPIFGVPQPIPGPGPGPQGLFGGNLANLGQRQAIQIAAMREQHEAARVAAAAARQEAEDRARELLQQQIAFEQARIDVRHEVRQPRYGGRRR
ncbi:hypothetical protein FRC03_010418 [Tulasnella sp. 419]|nr:hypothetical protein FRC03_010418 [Tulasnella sp. 419]